MLSRLLVIGRVSARYRLDSLVPKSVRPMFLSQLLWLFPQRWIPVRGPRGERLRGALEVLGPIAIKFGQALSTRRDLLPDDIAEELAKLQDRVAPFSSEKAIQIVQSNLGSHPSKLFAKFDTRPMAAASVAQIHAATLKNGDQVIVKILRPNIRSQVKRDLDLLANIAQLINRWVPQFRPLKLPEVVAEYAQAVHEELDLRTEAANTDRLRRNFEHSPMLYVPKVYWDYVHPDIAVFERIQGIPVDDGAAIDAHQLNRKYLAETGARIFFTQVFQDNFFHADMHPGNVYLSTDNPDKPHYIALDCAVMASLDEREQYNIARILLAIFKQDYQLAAELLLRCGWVGAQTRTADLTRVLSTVCAPIFNKPLAEISLGGLFVQILKTARQFDMRMQPELILLQKTLLQVEGLGRQLYPMLDLWSIGRPFLEKWLRRKYAPKNVYRRIRRDFPLILADLPNLLEPLSKSRLHTQQDLWERKTMLLTQLQHKWIVLSLILSSCILMLIIILLLKSI